jgi:hypothetical protein
MAVLKFSYEAGNEYSIMIASKSSLIFISMSESLSTVSADLFRCSRMSSLPTILCSISDFNRVALRAGPLL